MKGADIAGSVTEVHNGDLVGVVHLGGQCKTVCDREPGADDTCGDHQPVLGGRDMHRSALALARSRCATEVLRPQVPERHPFGDLIVQASVGCHDIIGGPQMRSH